MKVLLKLTSIFKMQRWLSAPHLSIHFLFYLPLCVAFECRVQIQSQRGPDNGNYTFFVKNSIIVEPATKPQLTMARLSKTDKAGIGSTERKKKQNNPKHIWYPSHLWGNKAAHRLYNNLKQRVEAWANTDPDCSDELNSGLCVAHAPTQTLQTLQTKAAHVHSRL